VEQRVWKTAAEHWEGTTRAAATALTVARTVPSPLPRAATAAGRALLGADTVPAWSPELPGGGSRRRPRAAASPQAVYFPACISTMFGASDGPGVQDAFLALCDRAGIPVRVPGGIGGLCCGTPWKSKGLTAGWTAMRDSVVPALREATGNGRLPVVVDAASCTEGLHTYLDDAGIAVVDAVAFVDDVVLPRLPAARKVPALVVHPTCSSTQLGLNPALLRVAAAAADEVVQPGDWSCCAFAGDRGLLHPELTAMATGPEARSVLGRPTPAGTAWASVNRTCELGMTRATGHPYRHVLEVLEQATRPR
jgi:D-lactate dehydrogenase